MTSKCCSMRRAKGWDWRTPWKNAWHHTSPVTRSCECWGTGARGSPGTSSTTQVGGSSRRRYRRSSRRFACSIGETRPKISPALAKPAAATSRAVSSHRDPSPIDGRGDSPCLGVPDVKDVGGGEKIHLVGCPDGVHCQVEAHPRLLQPTAPRAFARTPNEICAIGP